MSRAIDCSAMLFLLPLQCIKAPLTKFVTLVFRLPASIDFTYWCMNRYPAFVVQLLALLLPATLMAQTSTSTPTDSLAWAAVDSLSVLNLDEVVVTGTGTN